MGRRDDFDLDLDDNPSVQGSIIAAIGAILLISAAVVVVWLLFIRDGKEELKKPDVITGEFVQENNEQQDIVRESITPEDIVQESTVSAPLVESEEQETKILISNAAVETNELTVGIDVSKYQGNIDWSEIANAGIDFAMIRVGYRTMADGNIVEDESARYNLQEATANGIKVGAYFFSTAISKEEAVEEADWVADLIDHYKITYPVAYNCEGYDNVQSRQFDLTKEERTVIAQSFLNQIYENGYTPMFYASKGEMENDNQWMLSELEKKYKVWISWYPAVPYPDTSDAEYSGPYNMWQYTNKGTVPGIDYAVDLNVAYFGYEQEAAAKGENPPEPVEASIEAGHDFREVNETITAKEATNLRDIPSQGADSRVMYTLKNGETAIRTGISTSGWSRIDYHGEIYYAVSSLLTTDLTERTPEAVAEPDDGIKTEFSVRNEMVSPKIEVNLRTLPSVTNPDARVVVKLPYGSVVKRTGINEELGWSRVEYEGQVLYCVSSYVYIVE